MRPIDQQLPPLTHAQSSSELGSLGFQEGNLLVPHNGWRFFFIILHKELPGQGKSTVSDAWQTRQQASLLLISCAALDFGADLHFQLADICSCSSKRLNIFTQPSPHGLQLCTIGS